MFFDLHCHTSGISRCCKLPFNSILDTDLSCGYDGIVLTNHYTDYDLKEYGVRGFVDRYIEEFEKTEGYARKIGMTAFFGAEITMSYNEAVHLLIYGVTPEFLINNPDLPNLSQQALYEVCKNNGCALVNAHPYRYGMTVQDIKYLDGVEVNCHFRHGSCHEKELTEIAKNNGLALTCGCDYHGDSERPGGGIYLPNDIKSNEDLVKYIKCGKTFSIRVNDPITRDIYEVYAETRS